MCPQTGPEKNRELMRRGRAARSLWGRAQGNACPHPAFLYFPGRLPEGRGVGECVKKVKALRSANRQFQGSPGD